MVFKLEKYFKHILLIGGEGYIGRVVAEYLISSGYQVTSYDCLLYQRYGGEEHGVEDLN